MGTIPYLPTNGWTFISEPVPTNSVEFICSQFILFSLEKLRLDAMVDENFKLLGDS